MQTKKFRVFDKSNGQMFFYDGYLPKTNQSQIVSQCSSYLDQNDELIYDGDIVVGLDNDGEDVYHIIAYNEWEGKWVKVDFQKLSHLSMEDILNDSRFDAGDAGAFSVVGNIFETPDLIYKMI